jgi:predicted ester cyclase
MRTPADYTEHVHEFLTCYGQCDFTVQDMLCDDDKVYVRWQQIGQHLTEIMGFQPTGKTLSTVGSAVYRGVDDKIVEYWIQQENQGLFTQLRANASCID